MFAKRQLTRLWFFSLLLLLGLAVAPRHAMAATNTVTFTQDPPTNVTADQTYSVTVHVKNAITSAAVPLASVKLTAQTSDVTHTATPVTTGSANNTSITDSSGNVTFSGVKIKTVGSYELIATATLGVAVDTGTSTVTDVAVGAPSILAFTSEPASTIQAGKPILTSPGPPIVPVQVKLTDAEGNKISGKAITIQSTGPTLTGTLSQMTGDGTGGTTLGVASFPNLTIDTASTGVILIASINSLLADSTSFGVTAGTVATLTISQQPSPASVSADSTFSFSVTATDAKGNPVGGATVTLSLASGPLGATLTGGSATTADGTGGTTLGVATFPALSVNKVGTYTLQAASSPAPHVVSAAVTITAGVPRTVTITAQPSAAPPATPASVSADNTFTVSVTVKDAENNPVADGTAVTLTSSPNVTISGDTTTTTGGSATFMAQITTPDPYTLTVHSGTASQPLNPFVVTAGAVSHITISQQPTPATITADSTSTFSLKATATDAAGNPVGNAPITLSLSSGSAGVALMDESQTPAATPPIATTTAAGVASFSALSINKVGTYTVTAVSGSASSPPSTPITVNGGAVKTVTILSGPTPATVASGNAFALSVRALDAENNPEPDGTAVTVALTSANGAALTGGAATTTGGVATFNSLSINKVGSYTLKATVGAVSSAASNTITITPGAGVVLSTPTPPTPTPILAGNPFTVTVKATDNSASHNPISGAVVNLSLASAPSDATLTGGSATTANGTGGTTAGVATFTLILNRVGLYTLQATSGSATPQTGASFSVGLNTLSATFSSQPSSSVVAVAPFNTAVTVQDGSGNPAPDGTPVTLTLLQADGMTAVPAGTTLTGGSATTTGGVATFTLSVNKVGAYTLMPTSPAVPATPAPAPSSPITVTTGPQATLSFTQQPPTTVAADTTFPVKVQVLDAGGNPAADGTLVTLAFPVDAGGNPVQADGTTPIPAGTVLSGGAANTAGGSATFTLNVNKVGSYTLQATSGVAASVSSAVQVMPGTPAQAAFLVQPGATASGATITPAVVVSITDVFGNPVPGAGVGLTLSGTPTAGGAATLTGGAAQTTDANGRATFSSLSVDRVGSYTLVAAITGLPGITISSNAFTVGTGGAATLAFGQTPTGVSVANAAAGAPLFADPTTIPPTPITVSVVDGAGNPVPGAGVSLTLSGTPTAGGAATLAGATSQTTNTGGVATFSNLSVDKVGSYTLVAAVAGAPNVNSNKFSVTAVTAVAVAFNGTVADAAPDAPITTTAKDTSKKPVPVIVTVTDAQGNFVPSAKVGLSLAVGNTGMLVALDSSGKPTTAPLATVTTDANGQATFQNFGIDTPGTKTLVATATGPDGSTASGQSDPFAIGNLGPVISSLDTGGPLHAGDPLFTLKINGAYFVPGTTVAIAGQTLTSGVTLNSGILITVTPSAAQISSLGLDQKAGTVTVTVANPASGTVPAPAAATGLLPIYPLGPTQAAGGGDAGGNFQHFAAGLQMFSVPYDYSGIPVEEVLTGFQVTAPGATVDTASVVQEAIQPTLAVWDPLLGSYLITPALDKNSANLNAGQLALGQGYWGRFTYQPTGDPTRETGLLQQGTPAQSLKDAKGSPLFTAQSQFQIPLHPGWNMIGDPFPSQAGVLVADVLVQPAGGGATLGLPDANDLGYVNQTFYKYDTGKNAYAPVQTTAATGVDDVLRPYVGYWVRAYQPCTLLIPAPAQ